MKLLDSTSSTRLPWLAHHHSHLVYCHLSSQIWLLLHSFTNILPEWVFENSRLKLSPAIFTSPFSLANLHTGLVLACLWPSCQPVACSLFSTVLNLDQCIMLFWPHAELLPGEPPFSLANSPHVLQIHRTDTFPGSHFLTPLSFWYSIFVLPVFLSQSSWAAVNSLVSDLTKSIKCLIFL